MPPLEGFMEDQNQNAYSRADERYDHRDGRERIVYLLLKRGAQADLQKMGLGANNL
jgi:hypothetical protein